MSEASFHRPTKPFRRRLPPASAGAMVVLGAVIVSALAALPFSWRWYNVQALAEAVRHPPSLAPAAPIALFLGAGGLRPQDAPGTATRMAHRLTSIMGHDDLGRSLFFRVMPATLISLLLGLAAAAVSVLMGTLWGGLAAFAGGRIDGVMMRIVDVLFGLPYVLMVILLRTGLSGPLRAVLGDSSRLADTVLLFVAIGSVSWLTMARVVRGQVLSLRTAAFVEAARATGAGHLRVLIQHMVPNLTGPIMACAGMIVPQAILQESFLSFLGIGVGPPVPSLGRLAAEGVESVNAFVGYWWLLVFPCGALILSLLGLIFVADGVRERLDPKSAINPMA